MGAEGMGNEGKGSWGVGELPFSVMINIGDEPMEVGGWK